MPQDLLQGKVLQGRYTLLHKLGEGGFGVVYMAQEAQSSKLVSIKLLRSSSLQEEDLKRFMREARIIEKLRHPGVVRLYEHGQTPDGIFWIAMELLTGETLAQRMERGPLSEDALRALLVPLLETLSEVHEQGVVHRDLKPDNIFLAQSTVDSSQSTPEDKRASSLLTVDCRLPTVKILDFGIASLHGDGAITASTVISGTPRYMSPEQWRGLKKADLRADLYSLGIIAYEALSGVLPFEAKSPISWMRAHCDTPPKPLIEHFSVQGVSASLQTSIMRALAKDPAERFQSAGEFLSSLL